MDGKINFAVSEIVGVILVLMIIVSSMSVITFWGIPYMENQKATVSYESALIQFDTITDIIHSITREGRNSSSIVNFVTDAGTLSLDPQGERFIFYYALDDKYDFTVSGLDLDNTDGDENKFTVIAVKKPSLADITNINDKSKKDVNIAIDGGGAFTANFALDDAIKIDLKDLGSIVGRIWLFDVGSIIYQTRSTSNSYKVITENRGILSSQSNSGYVHNQFKQPNIFAKDGSLVMRVLQLKPEEVISGSGEAKYQIIIKLNNSNITENKASIPGNFKMQIYGDTGAVAAWKNYFTNSCDFTELDDDNLEYDGPLSFTLMHSICDISMRVVG